MEKRKSPRSDFVAAAGGRRANVTNTEKFPTKNASKSKKPSKKATQGPKANKKKARDRMQAAVRKRTENFWESAVKKLRDGLFKDGCCVIELPKSLRMGKTSVGKITSHVLEGEPDAIFQQDAVDVEVAAVGDGKRKMAIRDAAYVERAHKDARNSKEYRIGKIAAFVTELAHRAFGDCVVPNTPSMILSIRGCDRQSLHTDGDTVTIQARRHAKKISLTNPASFSVLVSLQGATVSYIPGSHTIVRQMSASKSFIPSEKMVAKTLPIAKNHALFFTQDLIHAATAMWPTTFAFTCTLTMLTSPVRLMRRIRCPGASQPQREPCLSASSRHAVVVVVVVVPAHNVLHRSTLLHAKSVFKRMRVQVVKVL